MINEGCFQNKTFLFEKRTIFWDMTPCSPFSCTRRFGGRIASIFRATCFLDGLLNYSSTLKIETIRSSETSGATQRTTRRHIPEDDTLHNHRCENLKSYISLSVFNLVLVFIYQLPLIPYICNVELKYIHLICTL
jgi:hypothetical protein